MILLHCFVVIKEMAVGRATSSILYNLLAKIIITEKVYTHIQHAASTSMVILTYITNFKRSNITQYLICEGLDVVGKVALLADLETSSLVKPPDAIWMRVWYGQ